MGRSSGAASADGIKFRRVHMERNNHQSRLHFIARSHVVRVTIIVTTTFDF